MPENRVKPAEPMFATPRTPGRKSFGPHVVSVAKMLGYDLMPWQIEALHVELEVHEDGINPETGGIFAYSDSGTSTPRQAGKTLKFFPKQLWRCTSFADAHGPQTGVHSAQSMNAAANKFRKDFVPKMRRSPLMPMIKNIRTGNNAPGVDWLNDSSVAIIPSDGHGGHGDTIHFADADEVYKLKDATVEGGILGAMATIANAQFCWCSTAGWQGDQSAYYNAKVAAGIEAVESGKRTGTAFFLYKAPEGADPDDLKMWAKFHPAVGYTQTPERLSSLWHRLAANPDGGEDEANRAFFNWPRPLAVSKTTTIPAALWAEQADPESQISGRLVIAVDCSPDLAFTSISIAGERADGSHHFSAVHNKAGTSWVKADLAKLIIEIGGHRVAAVALDPRATAGALIPQLKEALDLAGWEHELTEVKDVEYRQACGQVLTGLRDGSLFHQGDPMLTAAAEAAKEISSGEGSKWGRRRSGVDISAFCAATIALGVFLDLPDLLETVDYEDLFSLIDT